MMRWIAIVTLAVLTALLSASEVGAGGGIAPGTPGEALSGQTYLINVLMDPHMAAGDPVRVPDGTGGLIENPLAFDVTTTAKQAQVHIRNFRTGALVSQASFKVLPGFKLFFGCDTSLTQTRFVYAAGNPAKLRFWIPAAVMEYLFRPLGIDPNTTTVQPAITQVLNGGGSGECIADPRNPGPRILFVDDATVASQPGILLLEAVGDVLIVK